MAVLALPKRSAGVVALAVAASAALVGYVLLEIQLPFWAWPLIFFVSGFLADAITALAHFGFDYVFPYGAPILGPIAREFNEHHDAPGLDPGNLVDNLTKGAYASLVVSTLALAVLLLRSPGLAADFVLAVCVALTVWTLLFHQMHSYAHMGSVLTSDVFRRRLDEIAALDGVREQKRALRALFAEVPIPPLLRTLQTLGLTLNPERHNLHHIRFESDFSSVNGWSDPLLNPVLGPLARHFKRRREARQALVREI